MEIKITFMFRQTKVPFYSFLYVTLPLLEEFLSVCIIMSLVRAYIMGRLLHDYDKNNNIANIIILHYHNYQGEK